MPGELQVLKSAVPAATWLGKHIAGLIAGMLAIEGVEAGTKMIFGGAHEEKMLKKQASREAQERMALRLLNESEKNDELLAGDRAEQMGSLFSGAQFAQEQAQQAAAGKYRNAAMAGSTIANMPGLPTAMGGFGPPKPGEHPVSIADLLGVDL